MADELGDDIAEFAAEDATVLRELGAPDEYRPPANADDANRMLRKLRSQQRHRSELCERYGAEIRMLDAWLADRLAGVDAEIGRLLAALEGWMRGQHDMTGTLTEHLPAGDVSLRQPQRSVVVTDERQLVQWLSARKLDDAIKVVEQAAKANVGQLVEPGETVAGDAGPDHEYRQAVHDGEVVPGVALRVPTRRTFSAHPNTEEQR